MKQSKGGAEVGKVVLAYSGGLDTSAIVRWLAEKYGAEVITLTVDVGQSEDFKAIEERALKLGASKHYTIDAKEEFAEKYVAPAIKANALYEGKYPLSSALSRPLIAAKLVEVARREGADAVAHGCTGKGNDQVRFEVTIRALAPELKVLAPVREWGLSRSEELEMVRRCGVEFDEKRAPYSVDQNLWGRSIECGPLEDPWAEPPEDAFKWTVRPEDAPSEPEYLTIEFERGIPVAINGEGARLHELIACLNKLAGRHGVGRVDHLEDRLVGIKSREVYECPAAACILEAHMDLEKAVLTRRELSFKRQVDAQWAWLVYSGLWAEPLREDLEAFIDRCEERVSGEVRLKLYKGSASVVGRRSPNSLYDLSLATYEPWSSFDQSSAPGFIELWGLQARAARALLEKARKGLGSS